MCVSYGLLVLTDWSENKLNSHIKLDQLCTGSVNRCGSGEVIFISVSPAPSRRLHTVRVSFRWNVRI
jgi:hypothetical protein